MNSDGRFPYVGAIIRYMLVRGTSMQPKSQAEIRHVPSETTEMVACELCGTRRLRTSMRELGGWIICGDGFQDDCLKKSERRR